MTWAACRTVQQGIGLACDHNRRGQCEAAVASALARFGRLEAMALTVRDEYAKWGAVVKRAGAKVDGGCSSLGAELRHSARPVRAS